MISHPPKHGAECEVEGLYLRFHLGCEDIVRQIDLEVRGLETHFHCCGSLPELRVGELLMMPLAMF